MRKETTATTVDDYIAGLPATTQDVVRELRRRVHAALPEVQERISYGIPTFSLDGAHVIYVAGWKHHVGLYPVPDGDVELDRELAPHLSGRGTLKLPLAEPFPWDLVDRAIARQVATRVRQIRG